MASLSRVPRRVWMLRGCPFPFHVVSLLVVQKPYVWLLHHHCMGFPNNPSSSLRFLKVLTPQQLEVFFSPDLPPTIKDK